MTGTFKSYRPFNAFLLLSYGTFIKWPLFLHPQVPVLTDGDSFLSKLLFSELGYFFNAYPIFYSCLVLLLTYLQAIGISNIVNQQKLFPKPHQLSAMAYLLITSLFSSWYVLSPMLISISLIIPIIAILSNGTLLHDARKMLFNAGLLLGLSSLIYFPSIIYILLILLAVAITRPFRMPEWLLIFIGLAAPYYFFWAIGYLTGAFNRKMITVTGVQKTYLIPTAFEFTAIAVLVITAFVGFIFLQGYMRRLLVQSRKAWTILFLFLFVSVCIPFLNEQPGIAYCMPIVVSLSVIVSSAYFYPVKQWFPKFSHWALVALSAVTGYYFIFHK